MDDEQPEAFRLADELERASQMRPAALLRRQHAEIERLRSAVEFALDAITQREWFDAGRPGVACPDPAELRTSLRSVLPPNF